MSMFASATCLRLKCTLLARRCHRCGGAIRIVLDGEEWCDRCDQYQRPESHGWPRNSADLWDGDKFPEPCSVCNRPACCDYEGEASCGRPACELTIQIGLDFNADHDGSGR